MIAISIARAPVPRVSFRSRSEYMVLSAAMLLFVASAAATLIWCLSMSDMVVPMPGGWTLSMMWQPMCGRTWARTAASFLGMWVVMMVAMMLPSQVPMLRRYVRAAEEACSARPARLATIAGFGYLGVWTAIGIVVFPIGAALASLAIESPPLARGVPVMTGMAVAVMGALQFTAWKARRLACCRAAPDDQARSADAIAAWRHGLRHGVDCARCCGNLMAIALALGAMNLTAMVAVTAAITAERIAPAGLHIARGIGTGAVMLGLLLAARAF